MRTRTDYLNGRCTHHEYYSQFVTQAVKDLVTEHIGGADFLSKKLVEDPNLNNIPLDIWDQVVTNHRWVGGINEQGNGKKIYSLSNGVCVLKTAARMIVEEKEL